MNKNINNNSATPPYFFYKRSRQENLNSFSSSIKNLLNYCDGKSNGFTLAEVLITLVIIGVIAAITVPTLITKYQKEQTVTRLKKVYSALSQTTQRAIADNGPITSWEIGENHSGEASIEFFSKYLKPYLSIMKDCGINTDNDCIFEYNFLNNNTPSGILGNEYERFYLADGSLIALVVESKENGNKDVEVKVDINGTKKPNKYGKDIFRFVYFISFSLPEYVGKFVPGGYGTANLTDVSGYGNCNKNVSQRAGDRCTALIMKDGWQIKDDYPW